MTLGSNTFAGAPEMPYGSVSEPTASVRLTTEVGEPDLPYYDRTAWWKFTAPATETVGIDTLLTEIVGDKNDYDTVIHVYTGTALDTLTLVAQGDDSTRRATTNDPTYGYLTEMNLEAVAGTTYYVRVGSYTQAAPMFYVLRLGKRLVTITDWVQPPDFTTTVPLSFLSTQGLAGSRSVVSLKTSTAVFPDYGAPINALLQAARAEVTAASAPNSLSTSALSLLWNAGVSTSTTPGQTHAIEAQAAVSLTSRFFSSSQLASTPAPPDPEAISLVYEGATTVIGPIVITNLTLFWSMLNNVYLTTDDASLRPPLHATVEIAILNGPPSSLTDTAGWDLQDRTVLASYDLVTDITVPSGQGQYEVQEGSIDITEFCTSQGRFVLVAPLITELDDHVMEWPTQQVQVIAGVAGSNGGDISVGLRPPRYRYTYWDTEILVGPSTALEPAGQVDETRRAFR